VKLYLQMGSLSMAYCKSSG